MKKKIIPISVVGLLTLVCHFDIASADEAPKRVTIDEAIDIAGAKNPELALSAMSIDAQKRRIKSTKALRLPSLVVKSNLFLWNNKLEFAMPAYGIMPGRPAPRLSRCRSRRSESERPRPFAAG